VQPLQFFVGYAIVDNADAAVTVAVVETFERVQQQAMIAAIDGAMDDDAAAEPDRFVHALRFAERRAFYGRIGRIDARRKLLGICIDVKLTVTAPRRRRRHWHARVLVPFVDGGVFSCRHTYSPATQK